MKVVILAGGRGTRLSEETESKPKPLVSIGDRPILWHIMKLYSHFGLNDFVICLGYRGYMIKEFFSNYFLHTSDVTFDMQSNQMEVHNTKSEPWQVTLVDTGLDTMTGGRLKRIQPYLNKNEDFCMTYGDGVGSIQINKLIELHQSEGRLATLTAARPPGRFGALRLKGSSVVKFQEKPEGDGSYINGGFFVLSPKVLDYIQGDETVWEQEPLSQLAAAGQMTAYKHDGFWQPMDTLRDKNHLEKLWIDGTAPWKLW